jgi:hypothetical protein
VAALVCVRVVLFAICVFALVGIWYGEQTRDIYFFSRLLSLLVATLPLVYQPTRVLEVWHREPRTMSVMMIVLSVVLVFTLMLIFFPERLVQFLRWILGVQLRQPKI